MAGWDNYDNMMGGGLLGSLTEEEKRRLRMQSMGALGAGLLDGSGWSQTPSTIGQGLSRGMQYGQQAYQQGADQLGEYKDRANARDQAAAEQKAKAQAQARLDSIIANGGELTTQEAMQIISISPSHSNIVQTILKNQESAKPKEKLPLSAIGKQVYDMGITPGTPEWQQAYQQQLAASRASRAGGGDKPSALEEKIAAARAMGASDEEIRLMVLGRSGKDSSKGGRALPVSVVDKMGKAGANAEGFGRLAETFNADYAGNTVGGALENFAGRLGGENIGLTTEGQTQWWQDYQAQANAIRNDLFGAALTAQEKAEFDKAMISPNMSPEEIAKNLARQKALAQKGVSRIADPYRRMGYDADAIDAAVGIPESAPAEEMGDLVSQPAVGTVEDGHVFMGGDPADPKNWKRVQ